MSTKEKFKRRMFFILIVFWLAYYLLVSTTNLLALLKALTILPKSWVFASTNYTQIVQVIARYQLGHHAALCLLGLATVAEGGIGILFVFALFVFLRKKIDSLWIGCAFFCGAILWCLFIMTDEIFIVYNIEPTHIRLLILTLVSALFYVDFFKKTDEKTKSAVGL